MSNIVPSMTIYTYIVTKAFLVQYRSNAANNYSGENILWPTKFNSDAAHFNR